MLSYVLYSVTTTLYEGIAALVTVVQRLDLFFLIFDSIYEKRNRNIYV